MTILCCNLFVVLRSHIFAGIIQDVPLCGSLDLWELFNLKNNLKIFLHNIHFCICKLLAEKYHYKNYFLKNFSGYSAYSYSTVSIIQQHKGVHCTKFRQRTSYLVWRADLPRFQRSTSFMVIICKDTNTSDT